MKHLVILMALLLGSSLGPFTGTAAADAARFFRHSMDPSDPPYRLESVNTQHIRINGTAVRNAEIVTRALLRPEPPGPDTVGRRYTARFYLTETDRRRGEPVGVRSEYESTFERNAQGGMHISDQYVMPVIRNFPVFPAGEVKPGDQWTYPAWEIHDFRQVWGAAGYLRFDFPVSYRYEGPVYQEGRLYDLVIAEYSIVYRNRSHPEAAHVFPVTITGHSEQRLYWDHHRGRLGGSEEEYWIRFHLSTGQSIEYEGYARTEVHDEIPLDRASALESIRKQLQVRKIPYATVQDTKDGIAITLEEIGFPPDSADLQPREEERLNRIADILQAYPGNAIMITGHTALAGTAEGRARLSLARARAVGEHLVRREVRPPEQVFYQGVGARHPAAENSTEEGRRKNRRVEITILDN